MEVSRKEFTGSVQRSARGSNFCLLTFAICLLTLICSVVLLNPCLCQHSEELLAGPHIDGFRRQLSAAIVDERFGDARDMELGPYLPAGVKQHRVGNPP